MAYEHSAVVSIAGGYEVRCVPSSHGPMYLLDDSDFGFFTQEEAEAWAREHPAARALVSADDATP